MTIPEDMVLIFTIRSLTASPTILHINSLITYSLSGHSGHLFYFKMFLPFKQQRP